MNCERLGDAIESLRLELYEDLRTEVENFPVVNIDVTRDVFQD